MHQLLFNKPATTMLQSTFFLYQQEISSMRLDKSMNFLIWVLAALYTGCCETEITNDFLFK